MESEGQVALDAKAHVIIVGAGIAGVRTALTLRASGFEGSITLLNAEAHEPYDRPPLSKAVLCGSGEEGNLLLDPDGELTKSNVEVLHGANCVAVDRQARSILLENGSALPYDRLVIATGSSVRTLESLPPQSPGVHYLRTLDDSRRLRSALAQPSRVVIAGAGVIGLEVAASLRGLGHQVSVIDPASRVMGRSASAPLADFLQRRHKEKGVDLRLGNMITSCAREGGGFALTLQDGSTLEADHIVVGVGVVPNIQLAVACGLEATAQGIVTDSRGCTSDPCIFAAGEVAYHFNGRLGSHDRQETWAHAVAHGEHVARAIMGVSADYSEHSSYWTDQYDINVQVFGTPIGEDDVVRGDLASGTGLIFHMVHGRVAGVTAINAVRDLRTARKLIGAAIAAERLADVSQDLKQLVG